MRARLTEGRETVVVTGTTDTLQTDTAQLATRLDLQKIAETPVFGRKITNLLQLNAAVRLARGTGDLFLNNFLFVVNGSGRRQTTVQIDGSDGDDSWGRQTLFANVPLATLQEFTLSTNGVSAEYGRTTGSASNIVTKTGTNDLHADLIGIARPGGLQARAPGAVRRTIARLGQFSGLLSGPIKQDRTHFLVSTEVNTQRRDSLISSRLAPGTSFAGDYHQALFFGRIDHQLHERNALTLRGNLDRFTATNPADAVGGTNLPTAARKFSRRTYAMQVSETATLSPTLVNEARFQFQLASPITQFTPLNPLPQFVRTPGIAPEGESLGQSKA